MNANTAQILAEAKQVKAEIDRLTATLADLNDELSREGKGKHTVEGVGSFTVSENNTYSQDVMRSLLTGGQFNLVSERRLVPAKVKALYPEKYAAAKERKGWKVTLG